MLTAATGLGDPVQYLQLRPGLVTLYNTEMGMATRSQPNFKLSQIVIPVAAVSIAHNIGVTTPCLLLT